MKGATISAAMEDPKRLEEGLGHSTALVPNIDDKSIHLSEKVGKTDGGDDTHNEKEERNAARDHLLAEHGGDRPVVQQKSKRVATLDAFRGLTTAATDDPGRCRRWRSITPHRSFNVILHFTDSIPIYQQTALRLSYVSFTAGAAVIVFSGFYILRAGTLLYVIFAEMITFWAVVSGVLHKLGTYWKL